MPWQLAITALGVTTDAWPTAADLARQMNLAWPATGAVPVPAGLDALSSLAARAAGEAWSAAALAERGVSAERVGLLVESAWGTIDSTAAYLDTVFEQGGKYASPRHFTRSVYSSVASLVAIGLGIRGPCETLSQDGYTVCGMLERAATLLALNRADAVLVVWADQQAALAEELCRRAVGELHRPEYGRYTDGRLGHGTAAVMLQRAEVRPALARVTLDAGGAAAVAVVPEHRAYPTDAALALVAAVLTAATGGGARSWREAPRRRPARDVLVEPVR